MLYFTDPSWLGVTKGDWDIIYGMLSLYLIVAVVRGLQSDPYIFNMLQVPHVDGIKTRHVDMCNASIC